MLVGVRCRVSGVRENLTPDTWSPTPASLLATSATGPHPFASRTRSLSLSAPMVLRLRGRGRVGRRQLPKCKKTSSKDVQQHRSTQASRETGNTVLRDAFVLHRCLTFPRDAVPFLDDAM